MLIAALGTAAGAVLGAQQTPMYTATSSVMIDPRQLQVTNIEAVLGGLTVNSATIATQVGLLQSRTFVAKVMDDLRLFDDPDFNPALQSEPPTATATALPAILQPLEKLIAYLPNEWLIASGLASQPAPMLESEAPGLARERAISTFADSTTYNSDGTSYLISINFTSPDPDKAAVIANRIAELFVEDQLKGKLSASDKASDWLEQRIAALRDEVRQSEQAVEAFKAKNNLVSTQGTTLNDQELSDLNKELIVARTDLAERQAKLRLVRELRGSPDALEAVSDIANSPSILRLREQDTELARQESELRTLYGERHPRIMQLKDEQSKVVAKIRGEVDRVIRTLDNDVKVASTRVASIEGQLGGVKNRSVSERSSEVQLRELERVALTNRTLYEQFLQRFKETRDQQDIVEPDARIVSVAAPPVVPSTPGKKLFAAVGFTVSFLLGSALALVLERLDSGLRSAREVESALGLTTLGLVPRVNRLRRNQRPHQYLREKPLSAYAEAIRGVHTALKLSNPANPPKVVLVTSSLPEEGKTTFAVSLATLVARSQKRVLLVDLDLRHPSVHRELGWQVSGGLVEYMAGERSLQEVIHNDLETGLHFLPVKAQTTTPTDLLESERMRQLLQVCRENYDLIVLDSAPVASVNDTRVAATLADRVVFVVHWGKTIESAARDSLQSLRDAAIEPAGVVLTQIDLRKHARYGYGDIGQYYTRSRRYYVN
jgi:capsular exopolysaccharide synthesis family protein